MAACQTGGFYGLIEAIESLVGIIGPMAGGLMSRSEATSGLPNLTLCSVVGLYVGAAAFTAVFYHSLVERGSKSKGE